MRKGSDSANVNSENDQVQITVARNTEMIGQKLLPPLSVLARLAFYATKTARAGRFCRLLALLLSSGVASYGALGHAPPSTYKSESQLSKYCIVCEIS